MTDQDFGIAGPGALPVLEARIRAELSMMNYPRTQWRGKPEDSLTSDGERLYDVLIVGGGQSGLISAWRMMMDNVDNLLVLDENPENFEGPWVTFARMITLRTPKHLTGPDMGFPSLTYQAYWTAMHGTQAWDDLRFVKKEEWMNYLIWLRNLLHIPVQNDAKVADTIWDEKEQHFKVVLGDGSTLHTRLVVYATGIDGSGKWAVPKFVRDNLPKELYYHTREDIPFDKMVGKRIGVLGAGASAFDNASTALEKGCGSAEIFCRRDSLIQVNAHRWCEHHGFLKHHADLDDALRWEFAHAYFEKGQLPPLDTFHRCRKLPHFKIHLGSPWEKVEAVTKEDGSKVAVVHTPKGTFEYDYLIIGTGFVMDLGEREELASVRDNIANWGDVYTAPAELQDRGMSAYPYLTPHFQYVEKVAGKTPYLGRLFNFTFGALISCGLSGSSISGMKFAVPRLVHGVTRALYQMDAQKYLESLKNYDQKEIGDDVCATL